ncbi:MAG TPA: PilX N-terminal domain-containing pilus assembly protein [Thermoanaerobaculia bacterium]|jgi:Tfp pilus assembly protein PilX
MRTATTRSPAAHPAAQAGEAGSAYIAVLLVLVVLTILGLILALVTQTEMQVGNNERTVNRVFYAADSGIEAAVANILVPRDFSARTYLFTDTGLALAADEKGQIGTEVSVSSADVALEAPCNLCELNQAGYGAKDYSRTAFSVTATAARFATRDAGASRTPLAQKTISAMVQLEPFEKTITPPDKTVKP